MPVWIEEATLPVRPPRRFVISYRVVVFRPRGRGAVDERASGTASISEMAVTSRTIRAAACHSRFPSRLYMI